MKKVFLSLPMSGRTQENIEFTIKAMTKKAKEILGEDIEVSHLGDLKNDINLDDFANPGMFNMVHAASYMIHCDYFMGFSRPALNLMGVVTHSKHAGCVMEESLWLYSQRHTKGDPIRSVNGYYTSYKRLPMIDEYNISEFVPELGTKERVQAAKLLLNSSYGMHGGMHGGLHLATIPEEWKVKKEEAAKKNHAIISRLHGARSKVATIDDVIENKEEANNGKEENN